jgi:hypothetical protein
VKLYVSTKDYNSFNLNSDNEYRPAAIIPFPNKNAIIYSVGSSVSIVSGYGLDGRGFLFPFGSKKSSLPHSSQTDPGTQPVSYLMGTCSSLPGV